MNIDKFIKRVIQGAAVFSIAVGLSTFPLAFSKDSGVIIAIDTPNALIDELVATGFEKVKEVKKANLEDVFIHRTGKAWRED